MSAEPIMKMRARVEQCRRLAMLHDPRTTQALLQMADEGEADLKKLEAQEANQMPPPQQA